MGRIYNPEWLARSPYDDEPDNDPNDALPALDDDYIPEEYRDYDDYPHTPRR